MIIKIGDTFEHSVNFGMDQVKQFAEVTGDHNPIHIDENFAAETVFKKPIVHGFLAGAVFSKVFGTMFPGEGSIYLSQTLDFKRPVFMDTEHTAYFEVLSIDEKRNTAEISTILKNEKGKVCIDGMARVLNNEGMKIV